jgi:hypothetical protein
MPTVSRIHIKIKKFFFTTHSLIMPMVDDDVDDGDNNNDDGDDNDGALVVEVDCAGCRSGVGRRGIERRWLLGASSARTSTSDAAMPTSIRASLCTRSNLIASWWLLLQYTTTKQVEPILNSFVPSFKQLFMSNPAVV